MPGVTKEQIAAAKSVAAIDFLKRYRSEELVRAGSRGEFQLRSHDSFKISERTSLWHWKSRDIGGRSALDYLIHVEGRSFVEAVLTLSVLPPAAENNRRVFAYLMQRGIDRRVIESCVRSGLLYESAAHHNAVFVGRDESGVPRYVFLRGTCTLGKPFKCEAAGSDKRYSFCLSPEGESRRAAIYEAAVETLAHLTLEGRADKYRLSLGGVCAPREGEQRRPVKTPPALDALLARKPEIQEIEICLNNDFAGRWAAEHIARAYQDRYRIIQNLPEREGCDYADLAQEKREAARSRAAFSR